MPETMILIAGRNSQQGTSLNLGKDSAEYLDVTGTVEMNADDMARLGLRARDQVRLRSAAGETVAKCKPRRAEDLPAGLLFMAYGPPSSQLMGGETQGTGMPNSKSFEVEVEKL